MKKIACILLALSLPLILLTGCKGETINVESEELTVEKVAEIAQAHLEFRESKQVIETITNFDNPSIESVDEYGSESQEVWKVVFTTTLDGLLGPITIYLDKNTGDLLGSELRY
jgi:meiotically up-regulated gene 157 (Mug157) protein